MLSYSISSNGSEMVDKYYAMTLNCNSFMARIETIKLCSSLSMNLLSLLWNVI